MITSIEPKTGSWILLIGPRNLNGTLLEAIAKLGSIGPVRVLDGGNRFAAYKVARAVRGQAEILKRITVARAFNCYQVLSLLEDTPSIPAPFWCWTCSARFTMSRSRQGTEAAAVCLHRPTQAAGA